MSLSSFCSGDRLKKSLRLRSFKQDRSSNKFGSIDGVGFLI